MTAVTSGSAELLALAEELRERTALKYIGDCKCGNCQLVPKELLNRAYAALHLAATPDEEGDVARIKVQRDNALLDMERFMKEAQSAREATIEECAKVADRAAKRCVREKIPGDSVATFCAQQIRALSTGEPEQ